MGKMKKGRIPYGISNFRRIMENGQIYVDKTHYLEKLENLGAEYIIFLRPRRFGKSLFTSVLYNYYDKNSQHLFNELFSDTYIGQNKTTDANNYYILKFNFSGMSSDDLKSLKESFFIKTKSVIESFIEYYNLEINLSKKIDEAANLLSSFLEKVKNKLDGNIYVIIDEYDHFANNFLHNRELFNEMTGKDGFVRAWYEVLKEYTETIIARMFITGVSSLTLDSLTSGFNIATNITRNVLFHEMMGFNLNEVQGLIDTLKIEDSQNAINVMRENYNEYLFNHKSGTKVFNSNLVLYYLTSYESHNEAPEELIDTNIKSDYKRLTVMFDLFEDEKTKEKIITDISGGKAVSTEIMSIFELGFKFDQRHFLSLLYYLGLLTIDGINRRNKIQLKVPNRVIRHVYADYYANYLNNLYDLKLDTEHVTNAVEDLAYDNNITTLIEVIIAVLTGMSNCNALKFNESHLQTIVYTYFRLADIYLMKDEYHVDNGYIDLVFFSKVKNVNDVIIEFKYLTKDNYMKNGYEKKKSEALEQIKKYSNTEEMKILPNLKKHILIFAHTECVYHEEVLGNLKI